MKKVVWNTPSPSSGFMQGVELKILPQRNAVIEFEYEDQEEELRNGRLSFAGVVGYRVTYMHSLTGEMINEASDSLIEDESAEYFQLTKRACEKNQYSNALKFFKICFDDGPCYEFVCESFFWNES